MPGVLRSGSRVDPPSYEAVVAGLRMVHENGLGNPPRYSASVLHVVCDVCDLLTGTGLEPTAVEALLLEDEDHSGLWRVLADAGGEERQHFKHLLLSISEGSFIHEQRQAHTANCRCKLDEPDPGCRVHQTIAACKEYCDLVDGEWLKIADWYHPKARPVRESMGGNL